MSKPKKATAPKPPRKRPPGTKPVLVNVPEALLERLNAAVDRLREDPLRRDMTRTALVLVGIEMAVDKYSAKSRT